MKPSLHQAQQNYSQRSLAINCFAAPALGRFKTHMLLRLQYSLLRYPAIIISLHDFGLRHSRIGTKEKIVLFLAGRIADDDQTNGNLPADMTPQANQTQNQASNRIALFVDRYVLPAGFAIGGYIFSPPTLNLNKASRPKQYVSLIESKNND